MNWKDKGIILRLSKLGEYDAICCLLSEKHGKINGCVKGAFSKRMRPFLEIGSTVQAEYKTKSEAMVEENKLKKNYKLRKLLKEDN